MTKADYESKVNPKFCGIQAFAEWVKFSDSYPPLPIEQLPNVRFYELLINGSIKVIGIYQKLGENRVIETGSKFFKDILADEECLENSYWRYLPPPPVGTWYDDSGLSSDFYMKELDEYLNH
jgi:hypothetical protein